MAFYIRSEKLQNDIWEDREGNEENDDALKEIYKE
jgi:hypothetical protein